MKISCLVSIVETKKLPRNVQDKDSHNQEIDEEPIKQITYQDQFREAVRAIYLKRDIF